MQMSQLITVARWLRRRAENIAVALLCVMFATFIVKIFARYVLNNPVGWSEEVIITTWLWTVLWGAAFILRESEEIRFDIIYSKVSERTRRVFTVLTGVALIVLYGISLPAAAGLYPEISGSHHRCNVRFLAWKGLTARPVQTQEDVPFTLTSCT